jgi:hypothetical protein
MQNMNKKKQQEGGFLRIIIIIIILFLLLKYFNLTLTEIFEWIKDLFYSVW